jgi:hypothetical protein
MIVDFCTKPLNIALFLKYRDIIMNRKNTNMSNTNHRLPQKTTHGSQECFIDKGKADQEGEKSGVKILQDSNNCDFLKVNKT